MREGFLEEVIEANTCRIFQGHVVVKVKRKAFQTEGKFWGEIFRDKRAKTNKNLELLQGAKESSVFLEVRGQLVWDETRDVQQGQTRIFFLSRNGRQWQEKIWLLNGEWFITGARVGSGRPARRLLQLSKKKFDCGLNPGNYSGEKSKWIQELSRR